MPSITVWNRVEPRARSQDMKSGLEARLHDPLWLLARQWHETFAHFSFHDFAYGSSLAIISTPLSCRRCGGTSMTSSGRLTR